MFKLAELFVRIGANTDGIKTALNNVHNMLLSAGGKWTRIGQTIGDGILAPILGVTVGAKAAAVALGVGLVAAAGYGLAKCAGLAADLGEAISKSEQIFGSASKGVQAAAEEMADSFAIPRTEFLESTSMFAAIAQGAGIAADKSADMAVNLAKLAADATAFHNVDIGTALEKIKAGLSGESEPLKGWGVDLREAAVEAKALGMGLKQNNGHFTEQQKMLARYQLIRDRMKDADGALARESGHWGNQLRMLSGNLIRIGENVGTLVLPIFEKLLQVVNYFLGGFATGTQMILGWIQALGDFMGLSDKNERDRLAAIDERKKETEQQILQEQAMAAASKGKDKKSKTSDLESWAKELQTAGSKADRDAAKQLRIQQAQLDTQKQILAKQSAPRAGGLMVGP